MATEICMPTKVYLRFEANSFSFHIYAGVQVGTDRMRPHVPSVVRAAESVLRSYVAN